MCAVLFCTAHTEVTDFPGKKDVLGFQRRPRGRVVAQAATYSGFPSSICGGKKVALGQLFLQGVFPRHFHCTNAPYSFIADSV